MSVTSKILNGVLDEVAAPKKTLDAVRDRRKAVLDIAMRFEGANGRFYSGSVAHGTAIFDADADCGLILDRRSYPELGPDGDGVGPEDITAEVRSFIKEELLPDFPDVACGRTKRAITVRFNDPLPSGDDPTLDLIVALTRKTGDGLWIPNRDAKSWDASHPQKHTELINTEDKKKRVTRARAIRLVKAWNGQFSKKGLSSFNIEALALECLEDFTSVPEAMYELFRYAAAELPQRYTADPAGVSPSIKLLLDRETVVERLRSARDHADAALVNEDDDEKATDALANIFWKYVDPPTGSESKAAHAAGARRGLGWGASGIALGADATTHPKPTRSYGGKHER